MALSAHGITAAVELVLYILLLVPTIWNLLHHGISKHVSWLFLTIFTMVKITGAAMEIYVTQHPKTASVGIQVATQILYQVALGPLLSATLSFLNPRDQAKKGVSSGGGRGRRGGGLIGGALVGLVKREHLSAFLRLVHLVIMAAIALGVVGGIDRAPTGDGKLNSDYNAGATYLKVSSILLLVALVGITYGVVRYFPDRHNLPEPQRTLLPYIAMAIPLLFIRVLYSLLGAFNLSTTTETKTMTWNLFTGSVAAYVCMALIEQVGVVVIYTVGGFIARGREQREIGMEMGHSQWAGNRQEVGVEGGKSVV